MMQSLCQNLCSLFILFFVSSVARIEVFSRRQRKVLVGMKGEGSKKIFFPLTHVLDFSTSRNCLEPNKTELLKTPLLQLTVTKHFRWKIFRNRKRNRTVENPCMKRHFFFMLYTFLMLKTILILLILHEIKSFRKFPFVGGSKF